MKVKNETNKNLETNNIQDVTPENKKKLTLKMKIIFSVIAILILVVVAIGIWYVNEKSTNKWDIKQSELTIEYGKKYEPKLEDLIDTSKYPNVSNDNTRLEFNISNEQEKEYPATGIYDVIVNHKIQYKLFGLELFSLDDKKTVKINIKDTTNPIFVEEEGFNPAEIEVYKDNKIENINDKFKVNDLSKTELSIDDSNVDYSTVGEYDAKIIAKDNSNNVSEFEIKIKVIEPTITLEPSSLELTIGDESNIAATVKGKNQDVEWSSSDEGIAKVENGKVTAISKGTATITAKANNVQTTSTVNVKEKPVTTSKPSTTVPKTTNSSTTQSNNNGGTGTTTQKPQTTTPSTTTPTQTQPYWCNEGGKHHVINVGIGWFTSYNEATNAAKNFLIKNENYYHYQVDQCFCGKYTATVW